MLAAILPGSPDHGNSSGRQQPSHLRFQPLWRERRSGDDRRKRARQPFDLILSNGDIFQVKDAYRPLGQVDPSPRPVDEHELDLGVEDSKWDARKTNPGSQIAYHGRFTEESGVQK